jgi:DNA-binding NarL/FixJ family response regulator
MQLTDRLSATLAGIGAEVGAFLASHIGILQPTVLTPREIEILRLASEGVSGPAIAERLFVSPATIKTHFENI